MPVSMGQIIASFQEPTSRQAAPGLELIEPVVSLFCMSALHPPPSTQGLNLKPNFLVPSPVANSFIIHFFFLFISPFSFLPAEQIYPKRLGRTRPREESLSHTSYSQTPRITPGIPRYSRVMTLRQSMPVLIYFYSHPVFNPI